VAATILAGGMALSCTFGFVGCNGANNDPGNTPGTSTQTPGGETPGSTPGESQTPDYSGFSQILQNVINKSYYANLIVDQQAWDGDLTNSPAYGNAKYNAIPYGFLEEEGFDVNKIKNNQVDSKSDMYSIGNDLYIELRVETKASKNYYTNYLLKYTLSHQEMSELKVLFKQIGSGRKKTFTQAPMFVQETSYLKTPEVISKAHISVDSINAFETYADEKEYISPATTATYIGAVIDEYDNAKHTYQMHKSLVNPYHISSQGTMQIGTITFTTFGSGMEYINSVNVRTSTKTTALLLMNDERTNFEQSIQTVTYYTCESAVLENIFYHDSYRSQLFDLID
ncbi:MAG: hypothetical protein IJX18_02980, partial [Clostridia bacterium]|nr:hypothetical protein [Clostridia bacterium]